MAQGEITQGTGSINDLVSENTNSGEQQSFAKQMFGVDDPAQILTNEGPSKQDPNKVRYRFAGDNKVYTAGKDKTLDQVLESIWDHKSPGLLGSAAGTAWYGLPSDASSALAYGLNAAGFDQSSNEWRAYSDKLKTEFNTKYGQYMVPDAQAAWDQGKMMDYAMQTIGSGSPYVGLMLAGGLGGGMAGGAAIAGSAEAAGVAAGGLSTGAGLAAAQGVMRAGTMAGTFLGSTAITAPITVAQFADRQVANNRLAGVQDPENNIDWTSALGMGIAASGMQSLPIETILYGGPVLGALKGMGVDLGTNTSARILGNIADVAGTNAMVNMGTSVLSRAQADMPSLDDEAKAEYFNAMISGGIIGIPFGIGRGIVPHTGMDLGGVKNHNIQDIIDANSEQAQPTPPGQQGPIPSEHKMDHVFFNENYDYGIKDVYQAQEYLQSLKFKRHGVETTAFEDFRDGVGHDNEPYFHKGKGPNFTDQELIDTARRVSFVRGREDLVGGNKQGIMFNTAEELPQAHSDDPKVLTRAAFLSDKVGYPDAQVRRLSDKTINKLYEAYVKRITKDPAIQKIALDNVDQKVVEDYKNYGSLTARVEAKERIQNQVINNNKILSQNARQKLAQELMDKKSRMNERFTPEPPKGLEHKPDFSPSPEELAMEDEGAPSVKYPRGKTYINPRVDPEAIKAAQDMLNEDGKEMPFRASTKAVVDALNNTKSKIPPKRLATWLADQPLFKKLAETDDVAKELLAKVRRMNRPVTTKEIQSKQTDPTGLLSRGKGSQDTSPNPRDVLAEQKAYLESVARRDNENLIRQHPELAHGLNELAKALSERMPKSNILDGGKKAPEHTTTRAIKSAPLLDVLNKRAAVVNSFNQAFKTISDNNAKFFTDLVNDLINKGELTVKDMTTLSTAFRTALEIKDNLDDLNSGLVADMYKQIRAKLPLKQQHALDQDANKLFRWYKNSFDLNERDMAKFRAADVEATAFDHYIRGEFSPNLRDFRNSKHEQLFRQLNNVFRRLNKELGDQGIKNIDDVFSPNHAANEEVPPAARARTIQNIGDEMIEGPMKKDAEEANREFKDKTDKEINETPNNIIFRETSDDDVLGGFANNIGTPTLMMMKAMSAPAKGRMIPAYAELIEAKNYEQRQAAKFQMRIANKFSDAQHKFGNDKFYQAADFIAYLRETEQTLKDNGQGVFEVIQPNGTKATLSREFSNMIKEVNDAYKEAPRIAMEVYRKKLNNYDEEGLNENTSPEGIDRSIDKLDEAIKGNVIPEQRSRLVARKQAIETIRNALAQYAKVLDQEKPYVPYMRFGDYVVQVVNNNKKDDDGRLHTEHLVSINDANIFGMRTKLPGEKEVKQFLEKSGLKQKYGNSRDYSIRHFQMTYSNAAKYINKNLKTHELIQGLIANGMNHSLEAADVIAHESLGISGGEAKDILSNMRGAIKQEDSRLDRLISARGMGRFSVESNNVPGYSKDWGRVTEAYTNIFSNALARVDNARNWSKGVARIELEQGLPEGLRQELRDYAEFVTSPTKDWAHMRAFNFIWAMGFRPSSAVLQLFTVPQQVTGLMHQYDPTPTGMIRNMGLVAKNFAKASAKGMVGKKIFSPEIQALLIKNKGDLRATLKKDSQVNFGYSQRPLEKALNKAIDYSGILVSGAEQMTRETAFASFYEQFKNKNVLDRALKQRENDPLWQAFWKYNQHDMSLPEALSIYSVQETHGLYGKVGRGALQKGMVGSVFLPFTTYAQQVMEVLGAQLSGQRGLPGFLGGLWTAGSYLALAGMAGIPGWELWKTLIEAYEKNVKNVNFDTEMYLKEQGLPVWARKGILSTASGLDMSNRLSQNIIAQNIMIGLVKGDFKTNDLFGVPGTVGSGLMNGLQEAFNPLATTDSTLKALMPAMPASMQDAIKASQMAFDPANAMQTKTGKNLANPEGISNFEVGAQATGFTPLDKTLQRERIYWNQKVNTEFNQFKKRVSENLAQAQFLIMNGREEEGNGIKANISKELTRYARDNKMMLTPEFWAGLNRSVKERLMQKVNPRGLTRKPTINQLRHSDALYRDE